ncbi:MAG: toprim domain-containing protein, partial [Actinobacteria bacterium]|nr:toprim domain-containing protein [Actinomycetota bacterium]
TLRYDEQTRTEGRRERTELVAATTDAVEWYHQRLLHASDAGPARSYLRNRGLDGDTVRKFRLGWAPDGWDGLARALSGHGRALEKAGLVFVNRRGRTQDFFRSRVLFPIFDAQGDPVSFGGRVLPGAEGPKYRNTAETPLYHKSRVLYGLNWAKSSIVAADRVIICEGYTDVIGFASCGIDQAVATCGTALTADHVTLLRKFARRFVLAFDPDTAGQAAADRVYTWERTHDIDVSVVDLPGGTDPADAARRDPDALRAAVEGARPFLAYRVARVLDAGDFVSAEGRARVAERALAVIAEHPNELVRDPYVMEVADRCRLDPDRLRQRLARGGFASVGNSDPSGHDDDPFDDAPRPRRVRRPSGVETEALRLAVHRGSELSDLVDATLFDDPLHRDAFIALESSDHDVHVAAERLDPDAAGLLAAVAVEPGDAEPLDVATRLVAEAGRRVLRDLERRARGSDDPLAYSPSITWLKLQLEELEIDPKSILVESSELVRWLSEQDPGRA